MVLKQHYMLNKVKLDEYKLHLNQIVEIEENIEKNCLKKSLRDFLPFDYSNIHMDVPLMNKFPKELYP